MINYEYLHSNSHTIKKLREFFFDKVIGKFPPVNFKLVFSDGKVVYAYADAFVAYFDTKHPPVPYYKTIVVKIDAPLGNLPGDSICAKVYNEVWRAWRAGGEKFLKYMFEHYVRKVPFGIKVRTTDGKCFYLGLQSNFAPHFSSSDCRNATPIPFSSAVIPYWLKVNKIWLKKHGYLEKIRLSSEKEIKTVVLTWIVRDFTANKDYHFKTEEEAWVFAKKLEKIGHKYQLIRPTASKGFHYGSPVSAPKRVKPKPIAVTDPFHSTIHLKKPIPKDVAKSIAYKVSKKLGVKEIQKPIIHNIHLTHNKIHQPRAIQHTKRVVHVQNPHVVHDVKHTHHHVVHPVKLVHHPTTHHHIVHPVKHVQHLIRPSHEISSTKRIHHEQIQHVKEKTTSVVSLHGVNLAYVAGGIVVALLLLFLVIK